MGNRALKAVEGHMSTPALRALGHWGTRKYSGTQGTWALGALGGTWALGHSRHLGTWALGHSDTRGTQGTLFSRLFSF